MEQRISYEETPKGLTEGIMKSVFYLRKSGLDHKLLELVNYRVSQINGCAFCLDMHHKEAINMGESELRLHSLAAWKECPFYTEQEKAVLQFAEAVNAGHVEDAVFEQVSHFFSKSQIADLTLAIVTIISFNKLNTTFRVTPGNYKVGTYA